MSVILVLWQNFLRGDNSAFSLIYKNFFKELYAYGLRLGFNEEMCKDAIHDVFYKVFISKKQLTNVENIEFYLLHSLKNRLFDLYREEKAIDSFSHDEVVRDNSETIIEQIIKNEVEVQMKDTVNLLLQRLTLKQRKVIHYKYVLNLKYGEIAIIMDITPDAVKKMLRRALNTMRDDNKTSREFIIFIFIIASVC